MKNKKEIIIDQSNPTNESDLLKTKHVASELYTNTTPEEVVSKFENTQLSQYKLNNFDSPDGETEVSTAVDDTSVDETEVPASEDMRELTSSEYMKEYISSFDEAFPLLKNKNLSVENNSDPDSLDFSKSAYENPMVQDLLKHLTTKEGQKLNELGSTEFFLLRDNKTKLMIDNIKNEIKKTAKPEYFSLADDLLVINTENSIRLAKDLLKNYGETAPVGEVASVAPFFGVYFIYKNLIKTYEASTQVNPSKYSNREYQAFQSQRLHVIKLQRFNAIITAMALSSIASVGVNYRGTPGVEESSIPLVLVLFNKIRSNKIVKIISLLVVLPIIFIVFKNLLPYLNNITTLVYIKYGVSTLLSINIVYYILKLQILIHYNELGYNNISIPENVPKFIKTILLDLKEVSSFKSYNFFINLYIKYVIYTIATLIF